MTDDPASGPRAAAFRLRVGIAGAGLLGRLLAWRLAKAGHRVTVFDPVAGPDVRGAVGWTAAGMLSPLAELESADSGVAELGWRSLDLWPQWLGEQSMPVYFARRGSLLVSHPGDRGSASRLIARLASQSGPEHAPEVLDASVLRDLEPSFARGLLGWRLNGEGQIHSVQGMRAITRAASEAGVDWRWGTRVAAVESGQLRVEEIDPTQTAESALPGVPARTQPNLAGMQARASGVESFDLVFDVRGTGARPDLPVRGVRGEILWLHAPGVGLSHPVRLLHPRHRVYLVPRPDDIVVVGASEIESDDRSPISVRTMIELLSAAHSVIPELAEARVVHTETNLRPALPDNLPRLDIEPGRIRINGLFRHGWLIAPALVERALAAVEAMAQR
ncbi:MAG: thiO [Rhizobacter sp.]|nr:thiO [Rhizobacter sp.]